jgi:hypothetical protein
LQDLFVVYSAHQQNNPGYTERKYTKWEWLKINIRLKKSQSKNYPHYKKALLYCWLGYFYSILPFRREIWPLVFKIRILFFGGLKYKKDHKN